MTYAILPSYIVTVLLAPFDANKEAVMAAQRLNRRISQSLGLGGLKTAVMGCIDKQAAKGWMHDSHSRAQQLYMELMADMRHQAYMNCNLHLHCMQGRKNMTC